MPKSSGRIRIGADSRINGLATSGTGGRSLSFGIAESVTALADSAASADVAATLIANAVDLPGHPSISRVPALEIDPDSDLGNRKVVERCGPLAKAEIGRALDRGVLAADLMRNCGLIEAAAMFLRGAVRIVGMRSGANGDRAIGGSAELSLI